MKLFPRALCRSITARGSLITIWPTDLAVLDRRQGGVTLIAMMVGLVISLLATLVSLNLYKNLVTNSVVASNDASADGVIAALLLRLQWELSNAGYGLDPSANGHIAVLDAGRALVWRFQEKPLPSPPSCYVVRQSVQAENLNPADPANAQRATALVELAPVKPANCPATASLAALDVSNDAVLDLTKLEVLARFADFDRTVTEARLAFSQSTETCAPYGYTVAEPRTQVQVSAKLSAQVVAEVMNTASSTGLTPLPTLVYAYCLPNTGQASGAPSP
jgi:hypothetical protein